MMTITKSNYISCKQCEKLLWLEKRRILIFKIVCQCLIQLGCGKCIIVGAVRSFIFNLVVFTQTGETFGGK